MSLVSFPNENADMAFFKAPKDIPPAELSNKRKHSQQYNATGTVWGADSPSAAKLQAIKGKGDKETAFDDFGRYFAEKKRKLREQFHTEASGSLISSSVDGVAACLSGFTFDERLLKEIDERQESKHLFAGISIFVDGFTKPSHQELRYLMSYFGGVFENYFSRMRATHIICSSLPDSKIQNPRLFSRGLPIVKPEWIVDSIMAGKVLPWASYQLERIAYADPGQQTISFSSNVGNSVVKYHEPEKKLDPVVLESSIESSPGFPYTGTGVGDGPQVQPQEHLAGLLSVECVDDVCGSLSVANGKESGSSLIPPQAFKLKETGAVDLEPAAGSLQGKEFPADLVPEGATEGLQKLLKSSTGGATRGLGHSTLEDPEFVQNYFKIQCWMQYSRLHFIGTWRTRYQSMIEKDAKTSNIIHTGSKVITGGNSVIIHVDMDCFFVSVVIRKRLDLVGKPVAVCHSTSDRGTGEISSANYPARSFGVRAGMFVRDAKACCPELTIVPYDFAAYEEVAEKVYNILHQYSSKVQAVSCDEAFLDVTGNEDPMQIVSRIREDIYTATGCTASCGIGGNLLLARLATQKAKPNGQYYINPEKVEKFMEVLPVDELPGVGWALREKLHARGIHRCVELKAISKDTLQKDFGAKTGDMLWSSAQGIDHREVQATQARKSIGAEVNWGVRFTCMEDAQQFLVSLTNEVSSRLRDAAACGRTFTLKVKRRKEGSGEPAKFMGCGSCDNLSRSATVAYTTNSASVLLRVSRQLFSSLNLDVQEVRGIGLHVSRLQTTTSDIKQQDHGLDSWLAPSSKSTAGDGDIESKKVNDIVDNYVPDVPQTDPIRNTRAIIPLSNVADLPHKVEDKCDTLFENQTIINQVSGPGLKSDCGSSTESRPTNTSLDLPPLSQLDQSVLNCLPHDIVSEIKNAYQLRQNAIVGLQIGGRVSTSNGKGKSSRPRKKLHGGRQALKSAQVNQPQSSRNPFIIKPSSKFSGTDLQSDGLGNLLPDKSCKSEGDQFPNSNCSVHAPIDISHSLSIKSKTEQIEHYVSKSHFQKQNPLNFCLKSKEALSPEFILGQILQSVFSRNMYPPLSALLLSLSCYSQEDMANKNLNLDEVVKECANLFISYTRTIALQDLEEVYLVLLRLKRLAQRSSFWSVVESLSFSAMKDIVAEIYGGQLTLHN